MSMYLPLVPGAESSQKLDLLCSLTRLGETAKQALSLIYVSGYTESLAACHCGMSVSNVERSIATLEKVNRTCHDIAQLS